MGVAIVWDVHFHAINVIVQYVLTAWQGSIWTGRRVEAHRRCRVVVVSCAITRVRHATHQATVYHVHWGTT